MKTFLSCSLPTALVLVAVGCGSPTGWLALSSERAEWHQQGAQWVYGPDADDLRFEVISRGQRLRARALHTGQARATLRVESPGDSHELRLEPGVLVDLDLELVRGSYRVSAPSGVVLGSPRLGRPLEDPRLAVVVLVDTLRADHVDHYRTPGIVDFFRDGRRFSEAIANCSWTLPSMASLFASRPVLDLTSAEGDLIGIPEGQATWPTVLEAAGFSGGAVVANPTVHVLNGFARGFGSFTVPEGGATTVAPDATWVVEEGRGWLGAHRGEDAFLYLHLMDPHQPYRSHSEAGVVAPDVGPLAMRRRRATEAEAATLRRLYGEEVGHVESVLSGFLGELPEEAVVVFTSDHGEALGEHGAWGHGLNLYREALHVPLMIRAPDLEESVVESPVQLMDLGPALLELLGVAPDPEMAGVSLLKSGSPGPILSSTFGGGPLRWAWRDGTRKVVLRMAAQAELGAVGSTAMREGVPLPAGAFFFDLEEDPGEETPRALPDDLLGDLGGAFAASAGRVVPGLQLLVWAERGSVEMAFEVSGEPRIIQAWSTGAMTLERQANQLEVVCDRGFPLCALAAAFDEKPGWITPRHVTSTWRGITAETRISPGSLGLPPEWLIEGAYLWWNPERTRVVRGHAETLERLRALGYLE